ncbi:DUF2783 domain-containing protein [Variovorax rhizosphaerae]|uniref:DUF2783 domain-containing protein n=1 Tax=Variovorax rhizosphaerae TaxID=1836200 RepID=A0ABU8WU71_9BURK
MPSTQPQLDDLLESLIALTHGIPAEQQAALLARLVLVLASKLDDVSVVEEAIAQVAQLAGQPLERTLP